MYKQYASMLFDAMKNNNLPTGVKWLMGLGLGYVLSPIDIIPDIAVPGLGYADDLVIAALLIGVAGKIVYNHRNGISSTNPDVNETPQANQKYDVDL